MENRRVPVEAFLGPSVQLSLFPTNSTCSLEDPWEIAVYCESSKYHGMCVCVEWTVQCPTWHHCYGIMAKAVALRTAIATCNPISPLFLHWPLLIVELVWTWELSSSETTTSATHNLPRLSITTAYSNCVHESICEDDKLHMQLSQPTPFTVNDTHTAQW